MPVSRTCHALAGVLSAMAASGASAQTVIYVNGPLATGAGTGVSWADACRGPAALQNALDAAAPIAGAGQTVQVWVAAGTYVPTARSSPAELGSETFTLQNHEELFGGFVGNEALLEQRNPGVNVTTLSGTLDASHKAWHIVTTPGVDATCLIDGFVVRDGYGYLGTLATVGGGAISGPEASPLIRRCAFRNNSALNYGGAAYFRNGSPRFEDCAFSNNTCDGRGGAVFASTLTLVRCTFNDNTTSSNSTGGAAGCLGAVAAEGCVFLGNLSTGGGALAGASLTLTDCTFTANRSYKSAAALGGSAIVATGCIFDGNHAVEVGNGVCNSGGVFTDCLFTRNYGTSLVGPSTSIGNGGTFRGCRFASQYGEIWLGSAVNCVFSASGNIRGYTGGSLVNCTILSTPGGGTLMAPTGGAFIASSCIFWGNPQAIVPSPGNLELSYCDVQSLDPALGGVGNFSADPHLDAEGRLLSPSPCIDAGDSGAVPAGATLDAFGQTRFVDDPGMPNTGPVVAGLAPVDIGAFEFQGVTCYANCDGSTGAPVLNVADFGCFLGAYAAGSPYANCDASSTAPTLNVLDFTCFLRRFAAGCP